MRDEARLEDLKMFMVFAPAEPQVWFEPEMPPRPTPPPFHLLTKEEQDLYNADDESNPNVVEFSRRVKEADKLCTEWGREYTKQRHIQWPLAWAREVIRTLPRGSVAPAFR